MSVSTHPSSPWVEPLRSTWWLLAWGVASIVLGLLLFFQPVASAVTLVTFLAVFTIAGGIIDVVESLTHREGSWGWRLAGGVLGILVGLVVLAHPLYGSLVALTVLYVMIGLSAIVNGLFGLAVGHHSFGKIALSILLIAVGTLMLIWPTTLLDLVSLVQGIGIVTIVGGVLTCIAAFTAPRLATA